MANKSLKIFAAVTVVLTVLALSTHAQQQFKWDFDEELLEYDFTWSGIVAAKLRAYITRENDLYYISVVARTEPAIDVVWKMRDKLMIKTSVTDLLPRQYQFWQREGRYGMDIEIDFDPKTNTAHGKRTNLKGNVKERTVQQENLYDPISTILFLRRQPLRLGDVYRLKVFDGQRIYILKYEVVGREQIKTYRGKLWTMTVVPTLEKDSESTKEIEQKVSKVLMYLTEDEPHDIALIESDVFIGKIKARLIKKTGGKLIEPKE